MRYPLIKTSPLALAISLALTAPALTAQTEITEEITDLGTLQVLGTAEEQGKRSLGVSVITSEELEVRPPISDLSEVLRREPGVNLTGSASSGMRGNRRQIDIRGMGPDNTLVLIDGQPATSRNASRQGWTGERDSDGDTGWVPPEMIERVEILRGPAAARYGSGAMGGVINIITKRPTNEFGGSITYFGNFQENAKEGDTNRISFNLYGPLSERLTARLYGGWSETEPDALDINAGHAINPGAVTAGKTGINNRNINAAFNYQLDEQQELEFNMGYSRKADLYSGDSQNINTAGIPKEQIHGDETTIVERQNAGLTHRGNWRWGDSRISLNYALTENDRMTEGLFGGPEGAFLDPDQGQLQGQSPRFVSKLQESRLDGEVNLPGNWFGLTQVLTLGAEITHESLDDPGSTRPLIHPGNGASLDLKDLPGRNGETKQSFTSFAVYVEDNIEISEQLILTPAVRLAQHEEFGFNASPGISAAYHLTPEWTVRGGVALAYKTPSLYQANPNYLLYSQGIGCRAGFPAGGCYLQGNADLDTETSLNKEIGLAYDAGGMRASLAYFHNDYEDKIMAGVTSIAQGEIAGNNRPADIYQWVNTPEAVVSGLEGNLFVPLLDGLLNWNTNVTYMIESEDKEYGQPLSIIPEYTVNTSLDWLATDNLSLHANATFYGEQEPADFDIRLGQPIASRPSVSAYALAGISANYRFNEHYRLGLGVNNLFDKVLYREGFSHGAKGPNSVGISPSAGAGARTYNEHGRSFFVTLTASF